GVQVASRRSTACGASPRMARRKARQPRRDRDRRKPGEWRCHPSSMATSDAPLTCPACRIIDQADGVEDGNLYKVEHYRTRNERKLVQAVMHAQDRAADQITSFAGSLKFV